MPVYGKKTQYDFFNAIKIAFQDDFPTVSNFFFANFLLTVDRAPGYPHPHPEGDGADVDTVADADLEKRQELLFPEYLYKR